MMVKGLLILAFSMTTLASACQSCSPAYSSDIHCSTFEDTPYRGFGASNLIPCLVIGNEIELTIPVVGFDTTGNETVYPVYAFKLREVSNLPCGLCWQINMEDSVWGTGDEGCLLLKGEVTDDPGQYRLNITMDVDTTGDGVFDVISATLESLLTGGTGVYLRVIPEGYTCLPYDPEAENKIAHLTCPE